MWIAMRVPNHPAALSAALVGLVSLNVVTMRAAKERGYRVPSVYEAGIRFQPDERRRRAREFWFGERGDKPLRWTPEPDGREWWQTWLDNLRETAAGRGADCEDVACHQVAWYIVECALPCRADVIRTGPRNYHAIVRWPDGTIEDPSLVLGMPDPRDRGKGLVWPPT